MSFDPTFSIDGIIQASATLLAIMLALFFEKWKKYKKEKQKNKELAMILEAIITKTIPNSFILDKLFNSLLKFDENKLERLSLFLIQDKDTFREIYPFLENNPPKLPLLYYISDVNNQYLIAYPNFLNFHSEFNIYSLPGSKTNFGGTLLQLFPISDNGVRFQIWESIKKKGKLYDVDLDYHLNFYEKRINRKLRREAKNTYFEIINKIRLVFKSILIGNENWSSQLLSYYESLNNSNLKMLMLNPYYLKTEKGFINLKLSIFPQSADSNLFSKRTFARMRINQYDIAPNKFLNLNNYRNILDLRKKQLKVQELDDLDLEIIEDLVSFTPNKRNLQNILNNWVKSVGFCKVPKKYLQMIPFYEKMINKIKNFNLKKS